VPAADAELCATITFTQLEWSSAALAAQGLQLTDSLQRQLAAGPSGAAFFGSEELSDCRVVAGGQTLFCQAGAEHGQERVQGHVPQRHGGGQQQPCGDQVGGLLAWRGPALGGA
jgi:hypothetical protein